MIPYRDEKIQNAIAFFALNHKKKARRHLYQTYLYKYLAFLDFSSLKEQGFPVLGLTYKAMKKGPVPIEIYSNKEDTKKYKFVKDELGEFVVAKEKPNLDYFSPFEIELMEKLIEIYAAKWIVTNIMSEASHEAILAWRRTYYSRPNEIIDYSLEFEDDVFSKKQEQLTYQEEVFLTNKALAS
ncbi:MAG: SocA family protein [Nanoarchaeota archaeon]|nr:SocA family protein [Nanoarchaeota archaeon]MBU4124138.1 SocA family protein [Nanoarchaeota archaeon]